LLKAWGELGDDFDSIIAENLLVIDFDDPVVLSLRSGLDVEANRIKV
jgi:hypothetical protein